MRAVRTVTWMDEYMDCLIWRLIAGSKPDKAGATLTGEGSLSTYSVIQISNAMQSGCISSSDLLLLCLVTTSRQDKSGFPDL